MSKIMFAFVFATACAGTVKGTTFPVPVTCSADTWDCKDWTACKDGSQTHTCTLTFDCPSVPTVRPLETQECSPPEPTALTEVPQEMAAAAKWCGDHPKDAGCAKFAQFSCIFGDYRCLCPAIVGGSDYHRLFDAKLHKDGSFVDPIEEAVYAQCRTQGAYGNFTKAKPSTVKEKVQNIAAHRGDLRASADAAAKSVVEFDDGLVSGGLMPFDAPPAPEASTPFYKSGWFWAATGVVVAGAVVGIAAAAGAFSTTETVPVVVNAGAMAP